MGGPAVNRHKAVTLGDVAAETGLSSSTVSRALSRPAQVGVETARIVREAADRLGYRAVHGEPSPGGGDTKIIAVMIADLSHPFFFEIFRGIQDVAHRTDHALVLVDAKGEGRGEREAVERIIHAITGIILLSPRMADSSIYRLAKQRPTVTINREVRGLNCAMHDTAMGMRLAVNHLAELGHRSLTYIAGPSDAPIDGSRRRALEAACRATGMMFRRIPSNGEISDGIRAADTWLAHRTSAVLCYSDEVCVGFIRGVTRQGLSVPHDVSAVGIDNSMLGAFHLPRLTSVGYAGYAQGMAAMQALVDAGNPGSPTGQVTVAPMRLFVHATTGLPAR